MSSPEESASHSGMVFQMTEVERPHLLPLLKHLDPRLGRRLAESQPNQQSP